MPHSKFQRCLAMTIAFLFLATLPSLAQPSQTRRVTQFVDENNLVTLKGHVLPIATARNDRGKVEDNFAIDHMHLVLQRSPESEQELNQLMEQQNDKNSPNFHKWLTASEFGDRFGVAQGDIDAVTGWLESHGFHVNQVYPNRNMIDFGGTVRQIREGFHTSIHHFDFKGQLHMANMGDPQIPAALAPVVKGIASLNDIKPKAMHESAAKYTFTSGSSTYYAVTPEDNQTIYNLKPLYASGISGQGQTIYIVEDTNTYGTAGSNGASDWNTYRSTFGLSTAFPQGSYSQVHPGCADPGTNGDDGEAAIDVEVASAVAPNAAIQLISCASNIFTFGGQIALQNLINQPHPTPGVVSVSYGLCEAFTGQGGNAAFYNTYQQAAAEGFSVFVSSGDEGPSSCSNLFSVGSEFDVATLGVTGWGETPFNVTVGGTDFEDKYKALQEGVPQSTYWSSTNTANYGSALSYIPEIPWNDACASVLLSKAATGSFTPYGASPAFCNNATYVGTDSKPGPYLSTGAASGGASNCAIGAGGALQSNQVDSVPQCQGYPKPSWQSGTSLPGGVAVYGVPSDGVRDIPDVSMFAANGVWGHYEIVCWSDPAYTADGSSPCTGAPSTWAGFGGTSVAAPTMAAVQALINQKTGQVWGNPNPIYYQIAQAAYGTNGGSFLGRACNSSNGNPGACAFNDVTVGDIDAACEFNGTATESHCFKPAGTTHGVDSTDNVTAATVINGGSGYTAAPTCTIAGPTNNQPYLSPIGTTLYAGGTQATCTAAINAGTTNASWTLQIAAAPSANWVSGVTAFTVGGTTYTMFSSLNGVTTPNAVLYSTTGNTATQETAASKNLQAAINNDSTQCSAAPCFANVTAANQYATATESATTVGRTTTILVTMTAKTAGYAGTFNVVWGNGFIEGPGLVIITNTGIGQGPNYVSGITIGTAGSGYQPETPITLTGAGSGAIAVANTSTGTAAQSYQPTYGAAPGYDLATGLGTPNSSVLACSSAWGISQQSISWMQQGPYRPSQSPVTLTAIASSGLPVTYTVISGPGTISNGKLYFTGTGSIVIKATQNGNTTTCAATPVTQTIVVAKANQTITFTGLPSNAVYGSAGPYTLNGTASSGLAVTYSVTGPGSISGNTLTITGPGTVTVTASQAGNGDYNAATPVSQTIVVNNAPTGGTASIVASASIVKQSNGSYLVTVHVANNGTGTASNVVLTGVSLGSANGTPVPQSLGSLAGGGSANATVTVPASAGTSGSATVEKITGTYTGGSFNSSYRATLP